MTLRRTSFAAERSPRPHLVALVVWGAAVLALGLLAWTVWEARRLDRVAAALSATADGLRHEIAALEEAEGRPSAEAFSALGARIERLNALTGPRRAPLPRILEALEEAVPEGVRLAQLTYAADTGAFSASLLSEDETALPEALSRIEGLELLSSVILERQLRLRQGDRTVVQYDVRGGAS